MTGRRDSSRQSYRPTESKFKGGAEEMYVTYDLEQKTRGGGQALYPKVRRVYIAGDVIGWRAGDDLRKRTGRRVNGVRIEYEQSRRGYRRAGYNAERDDTKYEVGPTRAKPTTQRFTQIVEVPQKAKDVHFYPSAARLPAKYKQALQDVR
jgi:hypothetical protein